MLNVRVEVAMIPRFHARVVRLIRFANTNTARRGLLFADEATLRELNAHRQIIRSAIVIVVDGSFPEPIQTARSQILLASATGRGNVFGLMPHPDRACEERLGSTDGAKIFRSMMETITAGAAQAA